MRKRKHAVDLTATGKIVLDHDISRLIDERVQSNAEAAARNGEVPMVKVERRTRARRGPVVRFPGLEVEFDDGVEEVEEDSDGGEDGVYDVLKELEMERGVRDGKRRRGGR